jgi:putative ABC transport system permease protein
MRVTTLVRHGFGENTRMALNTLRTHKVRSFLTVLGVVIGVAAIIVVGSILVGLDSDIRANLNNFGSGTLFVFKFDPGIHTTRLTKEERTRKPLTLEDAQAIAEQCPSIQEVTVEVFPRVGNSQQISTARYGAHEVFGVQYSGTLTSYEDVYSVDLEQGRFFTEGENLRRVDVAVIGNDLNDALFPAHDGLGKSILVNGVSYRVLGVLAKLKGEIFKDSSGDRTVLVPYRSYRKHNPYADEHFIAAMPYPGRGATAEDEIRSVLRVRRNVAPRDADNFGISSAERIATQFRQITGSLALLVIAISSIGLLVGGIGVMNIMLMSVTERTREIGVRKALGARRNDIIRQFLVEAATLTGSGGLLGTIIGASISAAISLIFPMFPTVVPLWAVVAGVTVSLAVGLVSGMYPAAKAARLDPVEALRYE